MSAFAIDSGLHGREHTLIPLPALQRVDIVAVNDDSIDLIIVYFLNWPSRLLAQALLRISKDEVDLPRDRLRRLRVVSGNHHDLDASQTEGADRFADTVLWRVLEGDETAEAVFGAGVS